MKWTAEAVGLEWIYNFDNNDKAIRGTSINPQIDTYQGTGDSNLQNYLSTPYLTTTIGEYRT
jgi:hypothetical protein